MRSRRAMRSSDPRLQRSAVAITFLLFAVWALLAGVSEPALTVGDPSAAAGSSSFILHNISLAPGTTPCTGPGVVLAADPCSGRASVSCGRAVALTSLAPGSHPLSPQAPPAA